MIFTGTVTSRPFSPGSKSEHTAVVLQTERGEYVLRRVGGNPFVDPVLEGLVGKRVQIDGDIQGYNVVIHNWRELDGH
jgi:hypothetical protein